MLIDHKYKVDISQPMVPRYLPEPLYYSDQFADRFVISLVDGMEQITARGIVTAYFVREGTGETVALTDRGITDGKYYAVLDPACYAITGRCAIVIQVDYDGARKTMFMGHTKVVPSLTDVYVDPGNTVGNIAELINQSEHLYEDLTVALDAAVAYSNEISNLILEAQSQIAALADTSIHHYIQLEEPTENLRNGDLWTVKELLTWESVAEEEGSAVPWEDLSSVSWAQLMNRGEVGVTKTYYSGLWLLMSSVSVDDLTSAENENF